MLRRVVDDRTQFATLAICNEASKSCSHEGGIVAVKKTTWTG
jgi:hypothetical protein